MQDQNYTKKHLRNHTTSDSESHLFRKYKNLVGYNKATNQTHRKSSAGGDGVKHTSRTQTLLIHQTAAWQGNMSQQYRAGTAPYDTCDASLVPLKVDMGEKFTTDPSTHTQPDRTLDFSPITAAYHGHKRFLIV